MLKDEIGKYYFDGNYNCAETIIRAGNDYYQLGLHDEDMKMLGGFGAGIQCGNTCGAILSAASILSMKYIEKNAHESEDIRPVTVLLMKKFQEKYIELLQAMILNIIMLFVIYIKNLQNMIKNLMKKTNIFKRLQKKIKSLCLLYLLGVTILALKEKQKK